MTALDDKTSAPPRPVAGGSRLRADRASLGYGDRPVVTDLTLAVPDGKVTVIVGPNACGKSTFVIFLDVAFKLRNNRVYEYGKIVVFLVVKVVAYNDDAFELADLDGC